MTSSVISDPAIVTATISDIASDKSGSLWVAGTGSAIYTNSSSTSVEDGINAGPQHFSLQQNYPNPFNPSTKISYNTEKAGHVSLKIYNMLGQEVATLVNKEESAGMHTVSFNASALTSGIYIYKIQSGSFSASRKMLMLK